MFLPFRDTLDMWVNLDRVKSIQKERDGYALYYPEGGASRISDPEAVAALKAWLESQAPQS